MNGLKRIAVASLIMFYLPVLIMAQSPYRTCWSTDGWIIGAGVSAAAAALLVNQSIESLSEQQVDRLSRGEVNAFDRAATYNYSKPLSQLSDVLVGLNVAAAGFLLLDDYIREDWRTLGAMSAETALLTLAIPGLVKAEVQRIRPYVYNPRAPLQSKLDAEARRSFFSSHTSTAFATAVFVSTVYSGYFPRSKWKPYLWSGSLLTASVIGFLRFQSGKHFPSDILAGAAVGSAIGYAIPRLHRNVGKKLGLSTASDGRILCLCLCYNF